jgi:16S rRNA (adenine1518-N6/adenine1519-N6)-dimethyltransferase
VAAVRVDPALTHSPREINELLAVGGLSPRRAFGQNFVADPNTVRRIARLAQVGPGDRVLEIGAGLGSLTLALAETGAAVTAVEIDDGLFEMLGPIVEPHGVKLVHADIRTVDWAALLAGSDHWHLVANLPYNIATPLVLDLLDDVPAIATMLVMIQREVGERLVASAGSGAYGIPSVKVAYWATSRIVGYVPPTVFVPQPKVESALVRIVRRDQPGVDADPAVLFELVRTGFSQRRKMLRGILRDVVSADQFEAAEVRPDARAEELDLEAWGRLARVVATTTIAPDERI